MTRKRFRDKEEIGRELPSVQNRAFELLKEFDRNEFLVFSFSVMSGLSDVWQQLHKSWHGVADDPLRSMISGHLTEWSILLNIMITYAWHGLPPSSMNPGQPPVVLLSVVKGPRDLAETFVEDKIDSGQYDPANDMIGYQPFKVVGRSGYVVFVVRNGLDTPFQKMAEKWLDSRKLLADTRRVRTALRLGRELWLDDAGLHHPLQAKEYEDSLAKDLTTDGYLSSQLFLPHLWATDLMDVGQITAENAHIGKGSLNRRHLKEETEVIRRDFQSLPRFPETFSDMTGVSLDEFITLTHEIGMLAYARPSTVYIDRPDRMVKKLSKKTRFPKRSIEKKLNILDELGGVSLFRPIFRLSENLWLTSFDWAKTYNLTALNGCFFGPYDFDLRGKVFEKRCRKRLRDEGYEVHPGRLQISFPDGLAEIFEKVFRFKKKRTDLDIVAHKGGVLLLVECKEIKPNFKESHRKRLINQLQSRRNQLEFITRWMASSRANLTSLIPEDALREIGASMINNPLLIPIFLVNLDPQLPEKGALVVRYERLKGIGELPRAIGGLDTEELRMPMLELPFEVWQTDCTIRAYPLRINSDS